MLLFADSLNPGRDVVVTGIGLVTPLATDRDQSWRRLLSGDSAARELHPSDIDHFEVLTELDGLQCFGAPVNHHLIRRELADWDSLQHSTSNELRSSWLSEPVITMTLAALREAVQDAGIQLPLLPTQRSGCFIGASKGGLRTAERMLDSQRSRGMSDADEQGRLWWHAFQVDAATRAASAVANINAVVSCPVAACATGLISILQAAMAITTGQCEICIAGSADAALRASVLSSFHRLRVTSRASVAATACKPFDQSRDGFVIGEGAAVLVLETRQRAEARGAKIYARVTAGGWLGDPTGITQIDTSGDVVAELLKRTLTNTTPAMSLHGNAAGTRPMPRRVDYVNLHGTGTHSNDLAEANGLRQAFNTQVPRCSAFKGAIGHLLGAAGSVESALTMLALYHQHLPGTTNLKTPDPELQLPLIMPPGLTCTIQRAVKLSLGFGGHVACGVFDAEL